MTRPIHRFLGAAFALATALPALSADYETLYNGETLDGWAGQSRFWSVQDGVIAGETTPENPTDGNTFLVWQGGEPADFEFLGEVRFQGNNSGVQYRSSMVDAEKFVLRGYQADLHPNQEYFGMLYGEKLQPRGIIAKRGQRVEISADGEARVTGEVGDATEFKDWEWNRIRVVTSGPRLLHQINDITTSYVVDEHPDALRRGLLGLQLHQGAPMRVEFRNLRLRSLSPDDSASLIDQALAPPQSGAPTQRAKPAQPVPWVMHGPEAQWIWTGPADNEPRFFRKTFALPAGFKSARIYTLADNRVALWVNGRLAGESVAWQKPLQTDLASFLQTGVNQLALRAQNEGGPAGLALKLEITGADGTRSYIVSDAGWSAGKEAPGWTAVDFDTTSWSQVTAGKPLGADPWGIPGFEAEANPSSIAAPTSSPSTKATPPGAITVPEGFVVDLLHEVDRETQGSWVALASDDQGRLYASDQGKAGLFRITLGDRVTIEPQPVELSGAQGLEWAFDSLFVHRNGGHLYRAYDSDGDGQLDAAEELPSSTGGGEHGNHAVVLSPDREALLIAAGNHTSLPESHLETGRVPSWDEDLLLPRQWDGRGHAKGVLAPGGWVTRFDPSTKVHHLLSIGFRNQYDLAFNAHEDLFTFDADMEWDFGMPWYRPTRICQVVSGADYGWRSGTGKWPVYYEDSLPPVVEIGPGSPTGVVSGRGSQFPAAYQHAIFALDWTFGTIYAIHLRELGAGYTGEAEPFCFGSPLPLTDAVIGQDGALYFLTGGRGTQSALYRIRYTGTGSTGPAPLPSTPEAAEARALRRSLEAFHGRVDPAALPTAWPHLASPDRFLRHAARIAVESQPVERWAAGVFEPADPQTTITAAVALARSGHPSHRHRLFDSLLALDPASLPEPQLLGLLRAFALTSIRLGDPSPEQHRQLVETLDFMLPHPSPDVNTELIRLLVHLRAPGVISKGIDLISHRGSPEVPDWTGLASRNERYGRTIQEMLQNHPPSREIGYAFMLRNLKDGWTLEQRRAYFTFLNEAAQASGGASYTNFLANLRAEALGYCDNATREALADVTGENFNPVPDFAITPPAGPGQTWTMDTLEAATQPGLLRKASFENGRGLFHAIGCAACHRFAGLGGDIGPDLTSVRTKFDTRYLLESIVDPSRVISDQYSTKTISMKDGSTLAGLVVERGTNLEVYPPVNAADPIVVPRDQVAALADTPVSQMPPGLLNMLNQDEVRDLVAYIMSGGDPGDRIYK